MKKMKKAILDHAGARWLSLRAGHRAVAGADEPCTYNVLLAGGAESTRSASRSTPDGRTT